MYAIKEPNYSMFAEGGVCGETVRLGVQKA